MIFNNDYFCGRSESERNKGLFLRIARDLILVDVSSGLKHHTLSPVATAVFSVTDGSNTGIRKLSGKELPSRLLSELLLFGAV